MSALNFLGHVAFYVLLLWACLHVIGVMMDGGRDPDYERKLKEARERAYRDYCRRYGGRFKPGDTYPD